MSPAAGLLVISRRSSRRQDLPQVPVYRRAFLRRADTAVPAMMFRHPRRCSSRTNDARDIGDIDENESPYQSDQPRSARAVRLLG
jgi:hypothetical protein